MEELETALGNFTGELTATFIVSDAMDEYQSQTHLGQFLRILSHLQKSCSVTILGAPRSLPMIEEQFAGCDCLGILANEDGMREYVSKRKGCGNSNMR